MSMQMNAINETKNSTWLDGNITAENVEISTEVFADQNMTSHQDLRMKELDYETFVITTETREALIKLILRN